MGDDWIPEGLFALQPFTRNFFENTATVQVRVLSLSLNAGYNLESPKIMVDWLVSIICMRLSSCICSLILNRELCEAFPSNWTEHNIVPIFKSKGSMIPNNYRTLMPKLYGSIRESELSV